MSTALPSLPHDVPIVVTLPTYEEANNIIPLAEELLALSPRLEVLVIDDDSPDGTAQLVETRARTEPRLHLLLRTEDRGRGRSGRDGFLRALEMGAEIVVEMDADYSHQPSYIPSMVARLQEEGLGLVLGSRGVPGGEDADRGAFRRILTLVANGYIRVLLGISVKDCNSGFRVWRRSTLEAIRVEETAAVGPAIVQELLFKTSRQKIDIGEYPITFVNRRAGESPLTLHKLLTGYFTVIKLRWMALTGKL